MKIYEDAPCANSDDKDAWFVNKRGRLEPEDAREIREKWALDAERHIEADVDPTVSPETIRSVAAQRAQAEIDELERENRRRLREAIRACVFDCPMATRVYCLSTALEESELHQHGVRGGYMPADRVQMIQLRREHELTGKRVADVIISNERREALAGGGEPDVDQTPAQPQPLAPEAGAKTNDTEETP